MSSEIAIRAQDLSKAYPIFDSPQDRLKQMLVRGKRRYYRDFWAMGDVDLNICRGKTVGIVG
jgi:lipopolysaccharide transport system ATP-binding protein